MAPAGDHVVDISSDEEDFFMGSSLKILLEPFDPSRLSEVLDEDDDATGEDIDDLMIMSEISAPPVLQKAAKLDELVVMGELSAPPVLQKKASADGGCDEDDDDCVVLDGDPDKAVSVADEEGSVGDGSSDELQIVAEKGPVFDFFNSDL